MRFRPPTLHSGRSSSDQNNTTTKGKTQVQRALPEKEVQNLVVWSLVLSTVTCKMLGTVESSFISHVPHAPRTRFDAKSVRFETSTLGLRNCFKVPAALQLELQPIHQGSPRSCVRGAVTVRNPLLRVVNARLHGSSFSVCMSTSNRHRADLNDFHFAEHLPRWKRPFPTAWWHLMASHGSIGVSSSACGQPQNAFQLQSWLINNSPSLSLREFPSTRANKCSSLLLIVNA